MKAAQLVDFTIVSQTANDDIDCDSIRYYNKKVSCVKNKKICLATLAVKLT